MWPSSCSKSTLAPTRPRTRPRRRHNPRPSHPHGGRSTMLRSRVTLAALLCAAVAACLHADDTAAHWAFVPPQRPALPAVRDAGLIRPPVDPFNQDKPYDRFVQEQLAGDELAGYGPDSDVVGEAVELLTATHFLRNAPDGSGESDGNPDEVRIDRYTVLEGNLQNTMNCLLGLTVQCARCHAHKFEPIRHDEYYRLQAILYPVYPAYGPERWTQPNNRVVTIGTRARRDEHQRTTERLQLQIKALETGLQTMPDPHLEQLLQARAPEL